MSGYPIRIQRKRTPGWKMPPDTVYVGRPTKWGNPFVVSTWDTSEQVVRMFRGTARNMLAADPGWLEPLRGKNLACWCRLGEPCHADVLLELANAPACVAVVTKP